MPKLIDPSATNPPLPLLPVADAVIMSTVDTGSPAAELERPFSPLFDYPESPLAIPTLNHADALAAATSKKKQIQHPRSHPKNLKKKYQ